MATFEMTIVVNNLHGDYQLANGYGPEKAKAVLTVSSEIENCVISFQFEVNFFSFPCHILILICTLHNMQEHRKSFVTGSDFSSLSQNGINAVRIPVGWWIAYDPDPPYPFIGGSLNALDSAFYWAQ